MKLKLHIKHYRIIKKITQQKLAEITGLTQQYISLLENNTNSVNPTFDTIALLAQSLDICPYNIFSIECDICKLHHNHCSNSHQNN